MEFYNFNGPRGVTIFLGKFIKTVFSTLSLGTNVLRVENDFQIKLTL
jgi:hypothetical protein